MTRREKLREFIYSLYCPICMQDNRAMLLKIIAENDYRGITQYDENKMFRDCLLIFTKGKGERETYAGYQVTRVDIGSVGNIYADIAIYYDSFLASPRKIARANLRLNIPLN